MYEYIVRSELPPFEVYKLHQIVMDVVCGGGLGLNKESARPQWRSISDGCGGTVLLVRSVQPPLGLVSHVKEQPVGFDVGELRKFNCRLNLSTRSRVAHPLKRKGVKKVEKSLEPGEVVDWLKRLFARHGMDLQNVAVTGQCRVEVKRDHFINAADILLNARITDAALAEEAYRRGVGRKKAFGFGLLVEADGAS